MTRRPPNTRAAGCAWTRARWPPRTATIRREISAATLGAALPQEDAPRARGAVGPRRLPALRPARGRAGGVRLGRRQRVRQATAHHRALFHHRAAANGLRD